MPLLKASASDYTTVVKALANAGAAVSNPQGSRSFSKGSVAFVNTSFASSLIRFSSFLTVGPTRNPIVQSAPVDPNYTTYVTSLFLNIIVGLKANFAVDSSGNFYGIKSDRKLYKISPIGTETFIAGDGNISAGVFTPGLGAAAVITDLRGIVIDSSNNIFAGHYETKRVIKIEPNGNVTSYTGTGVEGTQNGNLNVATFGYITSMTIDNMNTLYVAEYAMKHIRKITSSGQVSTLTFTSVSTNHKFRSIVIDSSGIIYALDQNDHKIYKITPTGPTTAVIALLAGSTAGYSNGQGSAAQFNFTEESGLCLDSFGNVYVGDTSNGSVRKISPSGNVITIVGNGTNPVTESNTQLKSPTKPIVDINGILYIPTAVSIRKLTPVP
jgi:hypothetical protein